MINRKEGRKLIREKMVSTLALCFSIAMLAVSGYHYFMGEDVSTLTTTVGVAIFIISLLYRSWTIVKFRVIVKQVLDQEATFVAEDERWFYYKSDEGRPLSVKKSSKERKEYANRNK